MAEPVFLTLLTVLGYSTIPVGLPLMLPFAATLLSLALGYSKKTDKLITWLSLSQFFDSCGFRSAVTAKKLEEFIAPELEKRLQKRPHLYIEYGAGHCDIELYAKHEALRNSVLSVHKSHVWPLFYEYETEVCEIRPKKGPLPVEKYEKREDESCAVAVKPGQNECYEITLSQKGKNCPYERLTYSFGKSL